MNLLLDGQPNTDPCPEIARVPGSVAVCPECGGTLLVQVCAWEQGTGAVLEDGEGVEVDCENEPDLDDPGDDDERRHRFWQGEWMGPIDRVRAWARKHLRVAVKGAGE